MRTNEFVKKLQDLGLRVEKEVDTLKVFYTDDKKNYWFVIGDIGYDSPFIQTNQFKVFRKEHINVLNIAIEYIDTPLEEREEEKEYRLKVNVNNYQYLNVHTVLKDYFISDSKETNRYKTQFTQKEIDAMPFDTSFFIKEEVK